MDELWTLPELVDELENRMAALPPPANGQVRPVPDERTIRYYGTLGLLERPSATRGRTALYDSRHLAQVIAIKRLQTMGRSLAEIQALWPTLDDATLSRMSGVAVRPRSQGRSDGRGDGTTAAPGRREFWKPEETDVHIPMPSHLPAPMIPTTEPLRMPLPHVFLPEPMSPATMEAPVELRIELAPGVSLSVALSHDVAVSLAGVRAIRAAAAPLLAELARCRLAVNAEGEEP